MPAIGLIAHLPTLITLLRLCSDFKALHFDRTRGAPACKTIVRSCRKP